MKTIQKDKSLIFLLMLVALSFKVYAHKSINVTKTFNNVKIIFSTGYYYEEINKALIIGEYAEQLSSSLEFDNKITIWFRHIYTDYQPKSYTIKHGKENNLTNTNEIFLELYDTEYNIEDVLKLVEYSIKNINNFKETDGVKILKKCKKTKTVKKILIKKVYRPNYVKELAINNNGVLYYYQRNKFYIYTKTTTSDKVIASLDNIYQFSKIDNYSNIVFETDKIFYIFQNTNLDDKLNQYKIENLKVFNEPYDIKLLTPNILSLSLYSKPNIRKNRVILFLIKEKRIVQNLNSILDKK